MTNEDRFWSKVHKTPTCWLWLGGIDKDGYGKFQVSLGHHRQRHVRAARFSKEIAGEPLPFGQVGRHTCDVKRCVRPSHIIGGTQAQNIADKVSRQRQARGEQVNTARLSELEVRVIRRRAAEGDRIRDLAADFGVAVPTIADLVNRRSWRHVA